MLKLCATQLSLLKRESGRKMEQNANVMAQLLNPAFIRLKGTTKFITRPPDVKKYDHIKLYFLYFMVYWACKKRTDFTTSFPFNPLDIELNIYVGFEVLIAVPMKSSILWNIAHFSPL